MNQSRNAYQSYQRTSIETAPPEKLILMLYDGLIRFLNQAKLKVQEKNIEESHKLIVRSQDIVSELTKSLNRDTGDIARNLNSLYNYMYRQLIFANLSKDESRIQEVIDLVIPLRDAWIKAMAVNTAPAQAGEDESQTLRLKTLDPAFSPK